MPDVTVDQLVTDVTKYRTDVQAAFGRLQATIAAGPAISPAQQSAMNALDTAVNNDDAITVGIGQPATPPAARKS